MNDTQQLTNEQKKENIIKALTIAGFTENPEYPGMYARDTGNIREIVDMTAGLSSHLYDIAKKQKILGDDATGTLGKLSQMIVEAEDGRMPTKSDADEVVHVPKKDEIVDNNPAGANQSQRVPAANIDTPDIVTTMKPAIPTNEQTRVEPAQDTTGTGNVPIVPESAQACTPSEIIQPSTLATQQDLSVATIIKYINPKATEEEAYVFLQLCRARGLNPFLKEAHLIKYSHTSPASMVVGKDAFTRKAEEHKQFDGFEAGILVRVAEDTPVEERVGAFVEEGETLLGGWAKVHRTDHKHPSICKVSMSEYSKPGRNGKMNNWDTIPATMIRKVALVQALREAFPSELSGMYDQSEMGVEVVT